MNAQNHEQKQGAESCDCGCNCATTSPKAMMKWLVFGLIATSAVIAGVIVTTGASVVDRPPLPGSSTSAAWGAPLHSLDDLNLVATNTDAVFLVVPSADLARLAVIRKEVSTAAVTIRSRGIQIGTYQLSKDVPEYGELVEQVGAPAVLAMSKGLGMSAVADKDVTQKRLLQALDASAKPSGCGAGGCGAGGCGAEGCAAPPAAGAE